MTVLVTIPTQPIPVSGATTEGGFYWQSGLSKKKTLSAQPQGFAVLSLDLIRSIGDLWLAGAGEPSAKVRLAALTPGNRP